MTDNNKNLADKFNNPPGERQEPCHDACDEIVKRIKGAGIPITINAAPFNDSTSIPEIVQISRFINESRMNFREYKDLMDDILACGLGEFRPPTYPGASTAAQNAAQQSTGQHGPAERKEQSAQAGKPYTATGCDDLGDPQLPTPILTEREKEIHRTGALFSSSKSYSVLKYATEKYVNKFFGLDDTDLDPSLIPLPYLKLIESRLSDICPCPCPQAIQFRPLFVELIWNYWHEEGMLVHTINAIANRFENKRLGGKTVLGNLILDPLRPLSNLIWGYIQDKVHRLTTKRREFEYDHQYGITLLAGSGARINSAESNSFFIQAFHNLLHKCSVFYKEADNLFRVPDGFPILNALREIHLLLSEAAGNQFTDLTMTARAEMMLQQYILSRSEIREFLGARVMVPYDEPWMDKVDTFKAIMGWPGASISYYHDLAENGEKILLSIRWISWTDIDTRDLARDWALRFRDEIQRYIHCYQAVTGVDLSATEIMGGSDEKTLTPAFLIQRKLQRDAMIRRR